MDKQRRKLNEGPAPFRARMMNGRFSTAERCPSSEKFKTPKREKPLVANENGYLDASCFSNWMSKTTCETQNRRQQAAPPSAMQSSNGSFRMLHQSSAVPVYDKYVPRD